MFTREKYCAVCGCLSSLPDIRDPVHPDPDENPLLPHGDPYDSRILPRELTEVRRGSAYPSNPAYADWIVSGSLIFVSSDTGETRELISQILRRKKLTGAETLLS